MRAKTTDGGMVEYYGIRPATGERTAIEEIVVQGATGEITRFSFDNQSRPYLAITADGTRFRFQHISDKEIVVTATASDNSLQIDTLVDLNAPPPTLPDSPDNEGLIDAPSINLQPRSGQATVLGLSPSKPTIGTTNGQSPYPSECRVIITRCGLPVNNAVVLLDFNSTAIGNIATITLPASFIGNGEYRAMLPTQHRPPDDNEWMQKLCQAVADATGQICDVYDAVAPVYAGYVCPSLVVALRLLSRGKLPPPAASTMLTACETMAAAGALYCSTLGGDAGGPGSASLAEQLCLLVPEDRAGGEQVSIRAIAIVPTEKGTKTFTTDYETAPGYGPFPKLVINADDTEKPQISGELNIYPPRPGEGVSYLVTVEVTCAIPQTQVEMSISGTDEYGDIQEYTVEQAGEHQFTLLVPGADSGIRDVITVKVFHPDHGNTGTRQGVVVFG